MDGREGSEEKPGRGRRLGRGVLVAYLGTGAALAILRVSLLVWVNHRHASHTVTETVNNLFWVLRPEGLLGEYTRVGSIHFSQTEYYLFWGSVLTLGSFMIAAPILLVGWLRQRRR
jgi:hypothetical protein